ncbi:MAG: peptidase M28 family protein, partial [Thermoanaerobaculia bacterium]
MQKTVAALALAFALPALAQSNEARLVDYILANSQGYETLAHLTDEIGPRLSGSRNAELAVQWTTQ